MRYLECKHFCEGSSDMKEWNDAYPYQIFASVLLVDGKIENWWLGISKLDYHFDAANYLKDKSRDYVIVKTSWKINTPEEHDIVFYELSTEWFKQWELTEGFIGFKPYGYPKRVAKET